MSRACSIVIVAGGLLLLANQVTAAATAEPFHWNRAVLEIIAKGDPVAGEKLAKRERCSKCHGDEGIADEDDSPSLAGQVAAYHFKQLYDYQSKQRESRDMLKVTRDLSRGDMADLAAYFATLPREAQAGTPPPPKLVSRGDPRRLLLPCAACHGKAGEGMGSEVPAISGQKVEHFIEVMERFKEGDRSNDHYARMRYIATQLSSREIEQLAAWYAAPPMEDDEEEGLIPIALD